MLLIWQEFMSENRNWITCHKAKTYQKNDDNHQQKMIFNSLINDFRNSTITNSHNVAFELLINRNFNNLTILSQLFLKKLWPASLFWRVKFLSTSAEWREPFHAEKTVVCVVTIIPREPKIGAILLSNQAQKYSC